MSVYYNDNSHEVADWLEWLTIFGAIHDGRIDRRSIHEVTPKDLQSVTRAHFFAGIGGWDYALQLADWPLERPVWTASLPCQPFSVAGQQKGTEDERHLWPVFRDLVEQCRPAALLGEQVSSPAGRSWLASVQTDLEALGYSTAAADLCAAGIGAPHIRQRLYWVAQSYERYPEAEGVQRSGQQRLQPQGGGSDSGLAFTSGTGLEVDGEQPAREECAAVERGGENCGLGDPRGAGGGRNSGSVPEEKGDGCPKWSESGTQSDEPLAAGFRVWDDIVFVPCGDGKARPIKPGLEPLVNGVPNRLGRIRGYGNSIVPQVAAVFVRSFMDTQA